MAPNGSLGSFRAALPVHADLRRVVYICMDRLANATFSPTTRPKLAIAFVPSRRRFGSDPYTGPRPGAWGHAKSGFGENESETANLCGRCARL